MDSKCVVDDMYSKNDLYSSQLSAVSCFFF